MSEFEKALLFSEFLNTANFVFSNYMAMIFAMLTASYFLAHKMGRWVAVLFLALYSIGALMAGSGVVFAFTDFANLGQHIHQTSGQSSDLGWLGPATDRGEDMGRLPGFVLFMTLATYIGSMAFFFVVRFNRLHATQKSPPSLDADIEEL